MTNRSTGAGKWSTPLIAALLAALALFAWNQYAPVAPDSDKPVSRVGQQGPNQVYFGPHNSIAVLPFASDADSGAQLVLSHGIASELHRLLTRTRGLRVTSRNSSWFFQDRSIPLKVVAERLQVTHLLLGELQSHDNAIELRVSLFNAKKDTELWSQLYQRDLGEVFSLQDEIMDSVLEAMNRTPDGGLPRAQPVDQYAWLRYLEGLYLREKRTAQGLTEAEAAFRSALEIEPAYGLARVGLAGVLLGRQSDGTQAADLHEQARALLLSALENELDLPSAYGLISYIRHQYDRDWRGALGAAEQATRLSPGDPGLMGVAGMAMFTLGQFDRAGSLLEVNVMQDPLNLANRIRLGLLQEFAGNYDESLSSYRQVIGLNPEFPGARAYRARVKIIQDKPESALEESEQEPDPFWSRYSRILSLLALQQNQEAEQLLQQMIAEDGGHAAYQVAEILAFNGDNDRAFEWLQRAIEQKDGGMGEVIGNYFLRNLHTDPRWKVMLSSLGLSDLNPVTPEP